MFQFHKVRLKEGSNITFDDKGKFQFHKVRLKVKKEKWTIFSIMCFNSIRYD